MYRRRLYIIYGAVIVDRSYRPAAGTDVLVIRRYRLYYEDYSQGLVKYSRGIKPYGSRILRQLERYGTVFAIHSGGDLDPADKKRRVPAEKSKFPRWRYNRTNGMETNSTRW